MPCVHRELPAQQWIPKRTRADSKSHAETRFAPTLFPPLFPPKPGSVPRERFPVRSVARLESPDTQNAARPKARLRPTACPTGLESPIAKPKRAGIIIRVSGVRVPPPALIKSLLIARFAPVGQPRDEAWISPADFSSGPPGGRCVRRAATVPPFGSRALGYVPSVPRARPCRSQHSKCSSTRSADRGLAASA
jgi:hypothetical protein